MRQGPYDAGLGAMDAEQAGEQSISPEPLEGAALWTAWIWHVGALCTLASRVVRGHVCEFQPFTGSSFLQQGWKGNQLIRVEPNLGSGAGGCSQVLGREGRPVPPASIHSVMLSNFGEEVLKAL